MRTSRLAAAALLSLILALPVLGASHEPPSVGAFAAVPAGTALVDQRPVSVDPWTFSGREGDGYALPPLPPPRPSVVVPGPRLIVVNVGSPQPSSHRASGVASWYCGAGSRCTSGYGPDCLCAAAGPALRVGNWRGRYATVQAGSRHVRVRLIDCNCGPNANLLDLYRDAFSRLADPSRGVVKVSVSWQ